MNSAAFLSVFNNQPLDTVLIVLVIFVGVNLLLLYPLLRLTAYIIYLSTMVRKNEKCWDREWYHPDEESCRMHDEGVEWAKAHADCMTEVKTVSEDGLENANEMSVSEIKAWGGVIVYRSLDGLTDNFILTLIESENIDVLKAVYGDNNVTVMANGDIKIEVKAEDPQEAVWVFDLALRNNKAKRIVIEDGAITSRESITYNDSDAIGYGITVSAYPDATGGTHHEYLEGATVSA